MNSRFSLSWQLGLAATLGFVLVGVRADAAGSPNTRLIGLGINYFVAAPLTPGQLFEFDRQTGAATALGAPFLIESEGIGANLADNSAGQLFNVSGGFSGARVNRLGLTGDVLEFSPLSDGSAFPPFVGAISFDSQDRLYAATLNGNPAVDAPALLSRIDIDTGLATPVSIIHTLLSSMAFDANDNLYAVADQAGLVRIDVATGEMTTIGGDLGTPPSSTFLKKPIVFDDDNTLFAVTDKLLTVNPLTGATIPVGDEFGFYPIVGLAIIPVPEPGGQVLVAVAAVAVNVSRRRQRKPERLR
jgi:hypothetical protein